MQATFPPHKTSCKMLKAFFFLSDRPVLNVLGAAWAKFSDKYRFWQCQGEHTGFSSWLGPHVFPLKWVW